MTSAHHAREGDLLWDYPRTMPRIVGILAIAACFGVSVQLLRVAYVDELRFVTIFGLAFLFAFMEIWFFFLSRIPPHARALTDRAGHDEVVPERERREGEMERRVAEHEEYVWMRSSMQRMIRVFLVGGFLAFVAWLLGARMGVRPDLMLAVEQAACAVTFVAVFIVAWPHLRIGNIFR